MADADHLLAERGDEGPVDELAAIIGVDFANGYGTAVSEGLDRFPDSIEARAHYRKPLTPTR